MKPSRIVKLIGETESTLNDVIRDYGSIPMTEERAGLVADIIEVLDLVKEVKVEMREGMEGELRSLRKALDALQ